MMKRVLPFVFLSILGVSAHADVAYTDITDTPLGDGFYVGGNDYSPAYQFTSATSGALSSVQLVIGNNDGSTTPQAFTISLLTDSSGAPGTVLGTWNETTDQPFTSYVAQSFATTGPSLLAGDLYWLQLTGYNSNPNTTVRWAETDQASLNFFDSNPNGNLVGYGDADLFQVNTMATPEPAPLAALGLGALGLVLRRRRK